MRASRLLVHIASAILRHEDRLAMVLEARPGETPHWSVPSGRVEDGELVTEGLAREVGEETGLDVLDPGALAFVVQIDNRRAEGSVTEDYLAVVWAFEVDRWRGSLAPRDPDGYVHEARFMEVDEAIAHLDELQWQSATVAYLRGELAPGSLVLQRWHPDGGIEEAGIVQPAASGSRQRRPGWATSSSRLSVVRVRRGRTLHHHAPEQAPTRPP